MNHELFTEFVSKSNIYSTVIAILVTSQIIVVINSIFDNILSPIINSSLKWSKESKLKDYILTIYNIDFEIGSFLLIFIKFITIMLLLYYFITSNHVKLIKN
jgi:large-conductance mechanosensitive channel